MLYLTYCVHLGKYDPLYCASINVIVNGTGLSAQPVEQSRGRKMTPRELSPDKPSQNYSSPEVKLEIQMKIGNVKLAKVECCPLLPSMFPHLQEKLGKGIYVW